MEALADVEAKEQINIDKPAFEKEQEVFVKPSLEGGTVFERVYQDNSGQWTYVVKVGEDPEGKPVVAQGGYPEEALCDKAEALELAKKRVDELSA